MSSLVVGYFIYHPCSLQNTEQKKGETCLPFNHIPYLTYYEKVTI